jgi:cytochrome c553
MRSPFLLLLLLLAAPALPAAQVARPSKLGLCAACHGEQGLSRTPGVPHLAGQDEAYLKKALNDYRSGARNASPMASIANTLQPRDVDALAHWFANQPSFTRAKP